MSTGHLSGRFKNPQDFPYLYLENGNCSALTLAPAVESAYMSHVVNVSIVLPDQSPREQIQIST